MAFLNTGPSGFQNAPFSKLLLVILLFINISSHVFLSTPTGVTVCSTFASLSCSKFIDILKDPRQYWKFAASLFYFDSFHEIFLIAITLYAFRIFERIWGTFKLILFFSVCILGSFWIQFCTAFFSEIFLQHRYGWNSPLNSYIFALWVCYIAEIPALHSVSMSFCIKKLKATITEKFLVHVIISQMVLSAIYNWNFPPLILQVFGFLFGVFWQLDVAKIESKGTDMMLSQKLRVFLTKWVLSFFNSSQNTSAEERWVQTQRTMMRERAQNAPVNRRFY